MFSISTFCVIAVDENGRQFRVGEGLSYFQAEIVWRRLAEWNTFSGVFVKPEPSRSADEVRSRTRLTGVRLRFS